MMGKKGFIAMFVALILAAGGAAGGSTFEERKAAFLAGEGAGSDGCEDSVMWRWMENGDESAADAIRERIDIWASDTHQREDGQWRSGWDLTCIYLTRVLLQYGDFIHPDDKARLETQFRDTIASRWFFHGGSTNNRLFDFVTRYLHSQNHTDMTVQYGNEGDPQLEEFEYGGTTYTPGQSYNSLQIARDYLFWKFDELAANGDDMFEELDSEYTKTFVISFNVLYDFAEDEEMKKRAKMMLDLVLLDSIIDVSVGLHGGQIGRTYGQSVLMGHPQIYWWVYWGIGDDPGCSRKGQFHDAYVSDYRLPELIEDIGILDDEPDDYCHIAVEKNGAGYWIGSNNWTYVTKYFNLGGSNKQWMLNIGDSEGGRGIRLWINSIEQMLDESGGFIECYHGGECYIKMGETGFQYRNALLNRYYSNLHIIDTAYSADQWVYEGDESTGSLFDADEHDGIWRFLREGNVAVAIGATSAIEVAILGVDYSDYDAFKSAVLANASILDDTFTTSKGDLIEVREHPPDSGQRAAFANDELVWDQPFKRIEAEACDGEKIISWEDKVMTVQRHCNRIIYDFNTWNYTIEDYCDPGEEVGEDVTIPDGEDVTIPDATVDTVNDSAADIVYDVAQDALDDSAADVPADPGVTDTEGGCGCSMIV